MLNISIFVRWYMFIIYKTHLFLLQYMTKQIVLDFLTRHRHLCGTILLLVNMVNAYRDMDTGVWGSRCAAFGANLCCRVHERAQPRRASSRTCCSFWCWLLSCLAQVAELFPAERIVLKQSKFGWVRDFLQFAILLGCRRVSIEV